MKATQRRFRLVGYFCRAALVRGRFAAVFEAGLPPFLQPKGLLQEQSEASFVTQGNELDEED